MKTEKFDERGPRLGEKNNLDVYAIKLRRTRAGAQLCGIEFSLSTEDDAVTLDYTYHTYHGWASPLEMRNLFVWAIVKSATSVSTPSAATDGLRSAEAPPISVCIQPG